MIRKDVVSGPLYRLTKSQSDSVERDWNVNKTVLPDVSRGRTRQKLRDKQEVSERCHEGEWIALINPWHHGSALGSDQSMSLKYWYVVKVITPEVFVSSVSTPLGQLEVLAADVQQGKQYVTHEHERVSSLCACAMDAAASHGPTR